MAKRLPAETLHDWLDLRIQELRRKYCLDPWEAFMLLEDRLERGWYPGDVPWVTRSALDGIRKILAYLGSSKKRLQAAQILSVEELASWIVQEASNDGA